jgi:hypothetical protein
MGQPLNIFVLGFVGRDTGIYPVISIRDTGTYPVISIRETQIYLEILISDTGIYPVMSRGTQGSIR